ncbi:MAG: MBL fold metallo-hydrolase [Candidatus Saccharimonadales bacterium]
MKITKYVHACLLVETPERVALFDPGTFSEQVFPIDTLKRLDDIFITHIHADHCSLSFVEQLVAKFPDVRITAPPEVVAQLATEHITAMSDPSPGVAFFDAPHEKIEPLGQVPQEIGVHYLDTLSHPGDSHSFTETKQILALPMTAPWGNAVNALNLALKLKPQHVLPIHDWHWNDAARQQTYGTFERILGEHDITFHKLQTGEPIEINISATKA